MITLYHASDSFCSFKVRLVLEEKELPWESRRIDLMQFENLEPEYLEVNPAGLVPTLRDEEHTIFESSVINEYLEDRYPEIPLRPDDPVERARMRYWVKVEEDELFTAVRPASLNLMMKQVFDAYTDKYLDERLANHPRPHQIPRLLKMFRAPFDESAVERSRQQLKKVFAELDATLAERSWLCGESYSLADIAAAPVIDRVERLGLQDTWDGLANFKRWMQALTARPAYQRAKPKDEYRMPAPAIPKTA